MSNSPQPNESPLLPVGLPETWTFGRDWPCPRCAFNLRGRHDPLCPECGLRFRWQELVGVVCPRCAEPLPDEFGPICPHCFDTLNWAQLLGQTDPRRQFEFEYARTFVRPYLHTLGGTIPFWRFWSEKRVVAPVNRTRLKQFRRTSLAIALVGLLSLLVTGRLLNWSFVGWGEWAALAAFVLIPPLTALGVIAWYVGVLRLFDRRPGTAHRLRAYVLALPAWSGLLLIFAAAAASMVNLAVAWRESGVWGRATNALKFDPEPVFVYILSGRLKWDWHPVEAWYSIGIGLGLLGLAVGWWLPFLALGMRRALRVGWLAAGFLTLSVATISMLLICLAWTYAIPLSTPVRYLVGGAGD